MHTKSPTFLRMLSTRCYAYLPIYTLAMNKKNVPLAASNCLQNDAVSIPCVSHAMHVMPTYTAVKATAFNKFTCTLAA